MKLAAVSLTVALFASASLTAFAQAPESNHTIQARKANQQQRIAQGVNSGQLTRRETHHLEHQEHAINREERAMRSTDNGHLTRQDRKTIAAQQNTESSRIYKDKHNAAVR